MYDQCCLQSRIYCVTLTLSFGAVLLSMDCRAINCQSAIFQNSSNTIESFLRDNFSIQNDIHYRIVTIAIV